MERIHFCSRVQGSITKGIGWLLPRGANIISYKRSWTNCEEELTDHDTEHNSPTPIHMPQKHCWILLLGTLRALFGILKYVALTLAQYDGWTTSWQRSHREAVLMTFCQRSWCISQDHHRGAFCHPCYLRSTPITARVWVKVNNLWLSASPSLGQFHQMTRWLIFATQCQRQKRHLLTFN